MTAIRIAVLIGVIAVGLWPAAASAQAPMRTLQFDEVVEQAVAKNPTVASAATSIARAQALLQQARAALMPTVAATVNSVTYNAARGIDDTVTQPQSQLVFAANASMPLLAFESRARVTQGRDQIDVATLATADVRQQIAAAAAYAYLGVVAARRQIEVDERALEGSRAHLDFAQKRLEGGAGSRLNQLRAAQAVTLDQSRLEAATFALRQAQEALGVILAEEGPVNAGTEPTFDLPAAGDQAAWLAARPDVRLQARTIEAAERVFRDAWKVWLPTASVSFVPQAVAPASLFSPSRTWQLTFNVTQRLFDRRPAAERALRQVALSQAMFARDDVELRARSEERIAREAVASYERVLVSARLAAQQADEVLRITTSAFEFGATTNLEVIDAQRSARDAATSAAFAEDAARRARFELTVARGQFRPGR